MDEKHLATRPDQIRRNLPTTLWLAAARGVIAAETHRQHFLDVPIAVTSMAVLMLNRGFGLQRLEPRSGL